MANGTTEPNPNAEARLDGLSPREREILALAAVGYLDKQIGPKLGLSLNTLRTYWTRIRQKAGNHSRASLAKAFIDQKLKDSGVEQTVSRLLATPSGPETDDLSTRPTATPHNLPNYKTKFIGREAELEKVQRLLANHRLVNLAGASGVGKTRLAVQVAREQLHHTLDGVWFIYLAAEDDAAQLVRLIGHASIETTAPRPSDLSELCATLRRRKLLLVLDCDGTPSPEASTAIQALLAQCMEVRVMVVSNVPMPIDGELQFKVAPLSTPSEKAGAIVRTAKASEAVRLFAQLAGENTGQFVLTAENVSSVSTVCHRLGGSPLALELAVAKLPDIGLSGIALSLDEAGAQPNSPVETVIAWAHGTLAEAANALLPSLGIFAGSWDIPAAWAVGHALGFLPREVTRILEELVRAKLVLRDSEPERYRLSNQVREYTRSKLAEDPNQEAVEKAFVHHYARFLEAASPTSHRPGIPFDVAALGRDYENIIRAIRLGSTPQYPAEVAASMCERTFQYWNTKGLFADGLACCRVTLDRPEFFGHTRLCVNLIQIATQCAWMCADTDYFDEVLERFQNLGTAIDDPAVKAEALGALGGLAFGRRKIDLARPLFIEVLELRRQLGDRHGELIAMKQIGYTNGYLDGDWAGTEQTLYKVLEIAREIGNEVEEGLAYTALGQTLLSIDEYDKATDAFRKAVSLFRRQGHIFEEGWANAGLAHAALLRGELFLGQVLMRCLITASLRDRHWTRDLRCLEGLSACAIAADHPHEGVVLWSVAATHRERHGLIHLFPYQRQLTDGPLAKAREVLGEAGFEEAMEEGRQMPIVEALEYALKGIDVGWRL